MRLPALVLVLLCGRGSSRLRHPGRRCHRAGVGDGDDGGSSGCGVSRLPAGGTGDLIVVGMVAILAAGARRRRRGPSPE